MSQQQLLIAGIVVIAIVAFLFGVIILRQRRQIQYMQQPRYGFLGKPIMAAAATAVMVAGIIGGVTVLNQQRSLDFTAKADYNLEIVLTKRQIAVSGSNANYQFTATPRVDGTLNGKDDNATWNVYWNFTRLGSTQPTISKSELNRSDEKPSALQQTLQRGTYTVYVTIEYKSEKTKIESYSETVAI